MSFITAPIMGVASGILGAFGGASQGESSAQSAEYNASIARQNAEIAQQQGIAASEAQQRDAARKMGTAIANYGASGVQTDSGSPLDVLAESARMATLDNLTVKYNYALKAQGFQSQASLASANAKNARTSGILNAGSSLMNGYSMYTKLGGTGIPGFGGAAGGAAGADAAAAGTGELIGDFGMEELMMLAVA